MMQNNEFSECGRNVMLNPSDIAFLQKSSSLFKDVESSLLMLYLNDAERRKVSAQEPLLAPGQESRIVFVILSGSLGVKRALEDAEPFALLGSGECVCPVNVFDFKRVSAHVVAATDCEVLAVPDAGLLAMLNVSPQAAHNLVDVLANTPATVYTNTQVGANQEFEYGYHTYDCVNPVSGAYNRRWLMDNIKRLISRYSRDQHCFSFALVRLDGFADYNARFGALGGDQAVRTFAMTILQHIRPVDVLAHVDANRFVVFLPQANVEQSGTVVARIKSKIGEADITTPNGDALPPMPYSIGVCEGRADDTLDALIARADAVARRADTP